MSVPFEAAFLAMKSATTSVVLKNKGGLHYRRAGAFTCLAKTFQSKIQVRYGKKVVDGKSILALMNLGAGQGALLFIDVTGDDAQEAITALKTLVETNLGASE